MVKRWLASWSFAMVLGLSACETAPPVDPELTAAHSKDVLEWQHSREERLKKPTGWLTLAGLHWLKPGDNSLGGDPFNAVPLPESAPKSLGVLTLADGVVTLTVAAGHTVKIDGKEVTTATMLSDSNEAGPTTAQFGVIRFYVIERSERLAVRVKDENSAALRDFKGIERYPVDFHWKLEARFVADKTPATVAVPNVLGMDTQEASPGVIEFDMGGTTHRLRALAEPKDTELFVVFGDPTNGKSTYGGGRFLAVERGTGATELEVDFNRAYNPPCAYTPYATCPLPPAGNRLAIAVNAGEKSQAAH